jgi:5'-phosphate synthase pdxT subunit
MTRIGVLSLQGDFVEHETALGHLGVETRQVRRPQDLTGLDGLILPGGESTTFCRLILDFGLHDPLKEVIAQGLPVWGTCAGMIVLAKRVTDLPYPTLAALDISMRRNAYGRQVDSFEADIDVPALGSLPFHAVFIRAPVVDETGPGVEVLARLAATNGGSAVALRQGSILAIAFHPELTEDERFHLYFRAMVQAHKEAPSSRK